MNQAYTVLVYVVWCLSMYFLIVFILYLLSNKDKLFHSPTDQFKKLPKVSIVVPAFNEEKTIADTIESLKLVDYPAELFEIIIVNDGSTDNTSQIICGYADVKNITFIDRQQNKGKAASLNEGIAKASGEFVACADADSVVEPDIIKKTIPYFKNKKNAAVTVSVEVDKPKNLLQKIIEVEYAIGLSLALKVLSFFDSVPVTPGPFSIYRKSVLTEIGGFDEKNMVEDLEIAHRLQGYGHKIACCLNTKVKTTIPSTMKGLYRQRKRWYTGALLTIWQHKNLFFDRKRGIFGFFLPFNYAVIGLGVVLFVLSMFLAFSQALKKIAFFSLTNFNFLDYLSLKEIDPLSTSIFIFFGLSSIAATLTLICVGLKLVKKDIRKRIPGFIGFTLFFILYQVFWISSFFSAAFRREVKWR